MSYSFPTCPYCETSVRSWPPRHFDAMQVVQCGACGKNYRLSTWVAYECCPAETVEYVPLGKDAVGSVVRVRASYGWRKVKKGRREENEHLPPLDVRGTVEKVLAREVWVRFPLNGADRVMVFWRRNGEEKEPKHNVADLSTSGERRFWLSADDVPLTPAFVVQ